RLRQAHEGVRPPNDTARRFHHGYRSYRRTPGPVDRVRTHERDHSAVDRGSAATAEIRRQTETVDPALGELRGRMGGSWAHGIDKSEERCRVDAFVPPQRTRATIHALIESNQVSLTELVYACLCGWRFRFLSSF